MMSAGRTTVPGSERRGRMANSESFSTTSRWVKAAIVAGVLIGAAVLGQLASPLLLGMVAGIAGLLLILRWPAAGLALLAMVGMWVPLEIKASTVVTVNPAVLMVPFLLAVWLVDMLRRRQLRLVPSAANAPALAFVLAASLSLVLGNVYWDPLVPRPPNILWVQLGQWSIFGFSMLAFWLGANLLANVKSLKLVTYSYLFAGGVLAIVHLLPLLGPAVVEFKPPGATTSVYWVWLSALAGGQLLFNRQASRVVKLFCLLVLVALWSFALGGLQTWISGLVPMAATLSTLVALRFRKRALWVFLVLVLAGVLILPVLYQSFGWQEELEVSGGGRLMHYQIVLQFALRRPWFGLGMAAYRHYTWTVPVLIQELLYKGVQISSHNNYIDLFAQMGVVGLAIFLWLAIVLGRIAWRVSRQYGQGFEGAYANAALAGLVGTLISGLFGDWFLPFVYNIGFPGFRSSVMAWLFVGGLVALDTIGRSAGTRAVPEQSG